MPVAGLLPLFASMIIDIRAAAVVCDMKVFEWQGTLSCDGRIFALRWTDRWGALSRAQLCVGLILTDWPGGRSCAGC